MGTVYYTFLYWHVRHVIFDENSHHSLRQPIPLNKFRFCIHWERVQPLVELSFDTEYVTHLDSCHLACQDVKSGQGEGHVKHMVNLWHTDQNISTYGPKYLHICPYTMILGPYVNTTYPHTPPHLTREKRRSYGFCHFRTCHPETPKTPYLNTELRIQIKQHTELCPETLNCTYGPRMTLTDLCIYAVKRPPGRMIPYIFISFLC